MDYLKKNRVLIVLVIVMTVLNVVTLSFILFFPMRPSLRLDKINRDPGRDFVERELGFSEEQKKHHEDLRKEFFKKSEGIMQARTEATRALFDLIKKDSVSEQELHARAEVLGQLEIDHSIATLEHFRDIRALCTPEQREKFDSVVTDLLLFLRVPVLSGRPGMGQPGLWRGPGRPGEFGLPAEAGPQEEP
jgi:protein CpxP